ncbi:type II secretion system protein [Hippea alviniae]|uniref:type II secretion system protein n=1 Tax=Hippea alviniae TaxID=1279027 RepID=UPI0003B58A56|nr:type II secretion system protein [Hippea alviniae]
MSVKTIKGFTLVELLVSIVIALIVFVALSKALVVYTKYNVLNSLRNYAITIAQSCINNLRSGHKCSDNVSVRYRNFTEVFKITAPDPLGFDSGSYNSVVVTVSYKYGGNDYSYSITTTVYKP